MGRGERKGPERNLPRAGELAHKLQRLEPHRLDLRALHGAKRPLEDVLRVWNPDGVRVEAHEPHGNLPERGLDVRAQVGRAVPAGGILEGLDAAEPVQVARMDGVHGHDALRQRADRGHLRHVRLVVQIVEPEAGMVLERPHALLQHLARKARRIQQQAYARVAREVEKPQGRLAVRRGLHEVREPGVPRLPVQSGSDPVVGDAVPSEDRQFGTCRRGGPGKRGCA